MVNRTQRRSWGWARPLCAVLGAFALATALSGCIVVPARPYWHPYHYGYY